MEECPKALEVSQKKVLNMPDAYKIKDKSIIQKIFLLKAQGYSLRQIAEKLKEENGITVSHQAVKYILDNNPLIDPEHIPPDQLKLVTGRLEEIVKQLVKVNKEAWEMYNALKNQVDKSPKAAVEAVYILDKILKQIDTAIKIKNNLAVATQSSVSYIELSTKLVKVLHYLEKKGIIKILKRKELNDLQGSDVS